MSHGQWSPLLVILVSASLGIKLASYTLACCDGFLLFATTGDKPTRDNIHKCIRPEYWTTSVPITKLMQIKDQITITQSTKKIKELAELSDTFGHVDFRDISEYFTLL